MSSLPLSVLEFILTFNAENKVMMIDDDDDDDGDD